MLRTIGGIVAGILAAFVTVWLVELIGHQIYPVPSDLSIGNPEEMAAFVRGLPMGAKAFVVAAWFSGALVGGMVANRLTDRRWAAWAIAALVSAAAVLNIVMIPHPEWMQVAAVVAPLLGGLFASHLAKPRRAGERGSHGEV